MADDHQDDDTKDAVLSAGTGLSPEEVLLAAIRRSRHGEPAPADGAEMPDLEIPEPDHAAIPPEPQAELPSAPSEPPTPHHTPMIDRPALGDTPRHDAAKVPSPNPFVYAPPVVPRPDPSGTGFEFSVRHKRPGGRS